MKRITLKFIPGVFLAVIFLLSSCTSAYKVTKSEGTMVAIDSTWDVNPDAEAVALLAPYKAKVDSIMYRVVGTAEMSMDKGAPVEFAFQSGSGCIAQCCRTSAGQACRYGADKYGWFA